MVKKTTRERSRLKELWMLLFEKPESLHDEQITSLLEVEEQLRDAIYYVYHWFPQEFRKVQRYRTKKNELSQLSTEELIQKRQVILNRRASVFKRVPEEEISDSFFESPSIDSDEHILYELLKERDAV